MPGTTIVSKEYGIKKTKHAAIVNSMPKYSEAYDASSCVEPVCAGGSWTDFGLQCIPSPPSALTSLGDIYGVDFEHQTLCTIDNPELQYKTSITLFISSSSADFQLFLVDRYTSEIIHHIWMEDVALYSGFAQYSVNAEFTDILIVGSPHMYISVSFANASVI